MTALGPLVMLSVCFLLRPVKPKPAQGRLLDFAPVFRNTKAMGFVLGYGAHCFELYGIRTWLVAFWTFVAMKNSDASMLTPVVVSVLFSVLAMPASILGNECALRFGRHRAITAVMFSSAVVALLIGAICRQVAMVVAAVDHGLCDHGAGRFRRADIGHDDGRRSQLSRAPRWRCIRPSASACRRLGAWAVGVALDAAGGPLKRRRLDGGVFGAGGGYSAWSGGALLVRQDRAQA